MNKLRKFLLLSSLILFTSTIIITVSDQISLGVNSVLRGLSAQQTSITVGDIIVSSPWIDIRYTGAKIDGMTDDSIAFSKAILALPSTGGKILVPNTGHECIINASAIDPGAKNIIIEGVGWSTLVAAPFGNSQWSVPGAVKGSVIRVTGTADGIVTNNTTYRNLIIRDIAILGPGSGTSTGINLGPGAQNNQIRLNNVLVANFSTGILSQNSIDNKSDDIYVWGCGIGINLKANTDDINLYRVNVQACSVAIKIVQTSGIHFYGGLIQSNTTGILFQPDISSGGLSGISLDGFWFEGNTGGNIVLDTTNNAISYLTISNSRAGDGGIIFIITNMLSETTFLNNYFPSSNISLPSGVQGFIILGGTYNSISSNGAIGVYKNNTRDISRGGLAISSLSQQRYYNASVSGAFTPDYGYGENQEYLITGDTTINTPLNEIVGTDITLIIRQDGVGGHAIVWGGGYHTNWSDVGNSLNKYSSITFRCIGLGQWIQKGAQFPWTS